MGDSEKFHTRNDKVPMVMFHVCVSSKYWDLDETHTKLFRNFT